MGRGKFMYTYAIWNMKGGVGKTTCTVNLAYTMSKVYGRRVLVVDLDPQVNLTPFFIKEARLSVSIYDVLNKRIEIGKAINKSRYPFIDIIKGSTKLERTGEDIYQIGNMLYGLPYDVVLIDCSPSYDYLSRCALCAADEILVPIMLDGYCKDNLTDVYRTYTEILEYNENLKWKIFANRVRNNLRQRNIYQDLINCHDYPLYNTCIGDRSEIQISVDKKRPVSKCASKSNAAGDFFELAGEILEYSEQLNQKMGFHIQARRCVNGNI